MDLWVYPALRGRTMADRHTIEAQPWEIKSASARTTRRLGYLLGRHAPPGTILALGGQLGAGKTTLVQGLARGLEVPETFYITSPTFTLINEYPGRLTLYHVDLYRIGHPDEVLEIGLEEILADTGIVAIEWAERMDDLLPADRVGINITARAGDERHILVSHRSATAERFIKTVRENWRRAS